MRRCLFVFVSMSSALVGLACDGDRVEKSGKVEVNDQGGILEITNQSSRLEITKDPFHLAIEPVAGVRVEGASEALFSTSGARNAIARVAGWKFESNDEITIETDDTTTLK